MSFLVFITRNDFLYNVILSIKLGMTKIIREIKQKTIFLFFI